mmetsp:Transcript_52877/g.112887  ORF Transcript_52877/g.112887 Transcript_52877/m.112887 type:complete len:264 (+) Transcript_52877:834-1625(+)
MPTSRALMSSFRASIELANSPMTVSISLIDNSKAFCLSSASSNLVLQNSFLLSSSLCSFFKFTTISSTMAMTFSKPTFLPLKAKESKSNSGLLDFLAALRTTFRARLRVALEETCTCKKLSSSGAGKAFLKISRASSSFKTLMVSARATVSSARAFLTSSHSASLVLQPSASSAWNFWSSARVSLVFSRSSPVSATSTPMVPMRSMRSSICCCKDESSFCLAATRDSKLAMASDSSVVASSKALTISSPNVFRIPTISPLCGA